MTFIYGDCRPTGDDGGCPPPLVVQVFPPCFELRAMTRNPRWQHRRWRGAPVGTIDSAPLLFGRGAQVKVYAVVPDDPGLARRAMEALRSANTVAPVVGPGEPIPGLAPAVLAGREPCPGPGRDPQSSNSSRSRPTVRPGGSSRTRRIASRTPGTNASRDVVAWRISSVCACAPKIDRLVGDEARQAQRVDRRRLAPRRLGDQAGRVQRVPDGAVELRRGVLLDDLAVRHVAGRLDREAHHQHGRDREVRRVEDRHAGSRAPPRRARRDVVAVAGRAEHDRHARLDREPDVRLDAVRARDVDQHVDVAPSPAQPPASP